MALAELYVTADSNRLRQVLANLLDNAIKYTPAGGKVDIEAKQGENEVRITIKDTGVGISENELDNIWDRLYRGDKSRTERGLGLGLSLVKAIVGAHRVYVEVLSAPGTGSVFSVHIPA
ncbi:MAG: ATP-binding protein [Thermodesulfobacteriales bacterium]